jgi:hypothetical protein
VRGDAHDRADEANLTTAGHRSAQTASSRCAPGSRRQRLPVRAPGPAHPDAPHDAMVRSGVTPRCVSRIPAVFDAAIAARSRSRRLTRRRPRLPRRVTPDSFRPLNPLRTDG